jgi:polysaccharide deacetylase family sporulation protein PdaB
MKTLTVTKKKLLTVLFCALAAVLAVAVCIRATQAVQASAPKRSLPIYNVQTGEKKIALSFDAAWGNSDTQELIDILDQYHVKTTFFVVGAWVDKYPESVKALAAAGHEVCNHSDTHPHMRKLSQDEMKSQVEKCNEKIASATGIKPILFRPPYGDYNDAVIQAVESLNMYPIQWNVDSLDWKNPTPDQIANRVLTNVKPGSIVLFHNGAKNTPAALPRVLRALQAEGYQIVPVSQLIYRGHYTIDNAGMQIPDAGAASGSSGSAASAASNPSAGQDGGRPASSANSR